MNQSREPYLNSSKLASHPTGYSGMYNIRPSVATGAVGEASILGFSSYSGYSSGNFYSSPGMVVTTETQDSDSSTIPEDGRFMAQSMSPINHGCQYFDLYACSQCAGDMFNPCIGLPECNELHTDTSTWSAKATSVYYVSASGFSAPSGIAAASATATLNMSLTKTFKDDCPNRQNAFAEITGTIVYTHPKVTGFGGTMISYSDQAQTLGYSGYGFSSSLGAPIQLPYIDSESKKAIRTREIGYVNSFSGSSGCSGFSGFSGSSGFSASTGCSGI